VKLGAPRATLLARMDERFVASLPDMPDRASQLLSDLSQLNLTERLADSSVPLKLWLENAATLAGRRVEGEVFRRALASFSGGEQPPSPTPAPPLPWWRRAVFRRLAAGLSVTALGAAIAAVVILRARPIEPFPQGTVGIVVMAPPDATDAAGALCGKLRRTGARPIACVARTDMDEETALAKAKEVGAALFVELRSDKTARIVPLGAQEIAALLQGMPRFDASRETFAPSIYALALLAASGEPDLKPEECPSLDQGPIERLSLLVNLFAPACFPRTIDPGRLLSICDQKDAESDASCALARLLYAERWPVIPGVEGVLRDLLGHSTGPIGTVAAVKLARLHCENGEDDQKQATYELFRLVGTPNECLRMSLSGTAACVMTRTNRKLPTDLQDLEVFPIGKQKGCRPRAQAMSLGERAFWRGRGGRWKEAEEDYKAAYERFKDPKYALGQAEARLHQGFPAEALTLLQSMQGVQINDRSDDIYRGLLRWIAARDGGASADGQKAEAAALVELYRTFPSGAHVFNDPDPDLRRLCCREGNGASCPFDLLLALKTNASVEALQQSLSDQR
jgi:hypothetical protein